MGIKLFGTCPICGKKVCRAIPGSTVEVFCNSCKKMVSVDVTPELQVISTIIKESFSEVKVAND